MCIRDRLPAPKKTAKAGLALKRQAVDRSKERVRQIIAKPGDWIIPSDVDEFTQFPAPLLELATQMASTGCNHVAGKLVDRLSKAGELMPLREEPSIWEQYPIECDLTGLLIGGWTEKVTMASAMCELTPGCLLYTSRCV